MPLKKENLVFLLIAISIFLVGTILRIYNLNWGAPFYFHPDERNIASAVTRLEYPTQMNPKFFAYGSLPIYTIYFTALAEKKIIAPTDKSTMVKFENAIIISRIYSAIFSLLVVIISSLLVWKLSNIYSAALTLSLTSLSVGLIQYAHFGTFEMWLTCFAVLQTYLITLFLKSAKFRYFFLASFVTGILISVKISSIVFFAIPIFALIFHIKPEIKKIKDLFNEKEIIIPALVKIAILFLLASAIFIITNPYTFLDFNDFKGTIKYESNVATGSLPVFYTGEFFNTIPVVFQFFKIYPFLLNPFITFLFIPLLGYLIFKKRDKFLILLIFAFCVHFLSQAFLFAKWTRYMIPTIPFIYILISLGISEIANQKNKSISKPFLATCFLLIMISSFYAFSYFKTVQTSQDSRVESYKKALSLIPPNATILSEVYDLGIVPFNNTYHNIVLYNFYDLDAERSEVKNITQILAPYDYIILPSQRIMRNRIANSTDFPNGHEFYTKLFQEKLGFKKIYETPCDLFCNIVYMGNPVWAVEETANVFDHPTVFIFKKQK